MTAPPEIPAAIVCEDDGATLDLGADDCPQKPFAYDELRARIQAVLRRRHSRHDDPLSARAARCRRRAVGADRSGIRRCSYPPS